MPSRKIKRTFTFDLHGYSLNEANIKINEIIYQAYNNEVVKLIIVTGKGLHSQNEKNPYVSNKPACGKDSNFKGRFDRQGGKYIARSDSYIETGSLYVTTNSDSSMFGFGKCPSYGKDNMLGMVVFMTGDHNCSVVRQIDTQSQFNAISLASCVASPCLDPNNIVVRNFSFDWS